MSHRGTRLLWGVAAWTAWAAAAVNGQDSRAAFAASRPSETAWPEARGGPANLGVAPGPGPAWTGVAWRYASGDPILGQPAVVGGRVYVLTAGNRVACVDAADGREIYSKRVVAIDADVVAAKRDERFAYAAPLVVGDRLYAAHENGTLYGIDLATGDVRFATPLGGKLWAAPKSDGRTVVVPSFDGIVHGLDARTGDVRWRVRAAAPYEIGSTPTLIGSEAWIPCYGRRMLVVNLDSGAYEAVPTEFSTSSTAAFAFGRLFLRTQDGKFSAFDVVRRELAWSTKEPGDWNRSGSACDGVRTYFAAPGGVRAFDPVDGRKLWEFPLKTSPIHSSPVVVGGRVVFGAEDGKLRVLDAADGALLREFDLGEPLTASPAVAGTRAFVGGASVGSLFAVD